MTTKQLLSLLSDLDPAGNRPVFVEVEGTINAPIGELYRVSLTAGVTTNSTRLILIGKSGRARAPRKQRVKPTFDPEPIKLGFAPHDYISNPHARGCKVCGMSITDTIHLPLTSNLQ